MFRTAFIIGMTVVFASIAFGLEGWGTEDNPWRIQTLADFNEYVNTPLHWYGYQHARLETDVNLAGVVYSDALIAPGSHVEGFMGVFDGNDHKITGLTIESVGNDYVGLFGYLDGGAIKNLGLEDCSVRAQKDYRWEGGNVVGGLVGENRSGGISGCHFIGSVTGESNVGGLVGKTRNGCISNCYSKGNVKGSEENTGGLVGQSEHTCISGSYSIGDVVGGAGVGGLVGETSLGILGGATSLGSSITNCYSTGDIRGDGPVGGLVGYNEVGNVVNCYSVGDVGGTDDVGGLVGWNYYGSVSHCYSSCDVNGVENAGGIVGKNCGFYSGGSVSNCFWNVDAQSHGVTDGVGANCGMQSNLAGLSRVEMQTASTFTSSGWDFMGERGNGTSETWEMGGDDGYPVLSFFHREPPFPLAGMGTIDEPYLIGDANELGMVNWYLGSFYVDINPFWEVYWYSSNFKLVKDIDLSGINWSVAVVPGFSDYFDGGGHRLMNMRISGSSYLGFVGYLGYGYYNYGLVPSGIANLGIDGCIVEGTGDYIGGLAGFIYGSVVSNCYSTGYVGGFGSVGGLVGLHDGSPLVDCYSAGFVSGVKNVGGLTGEVDGGDIYSCYSTAETRGSDRVGGLVGKQFAWSWYSTVRGCYSTGNVTGNRSVGGLIGEMDGYPGDPFTDSRAYDCYSIGDVNGVEDVGGLVGEGWGDIDDCFWNTETQTHGVIEGVGSGGLDADVTGLTTEAMNTRDAYHGFDFDYLWDLSCEGMNYPRLIWEVAVGDFACPHGVDCFDFGFFANRWMDTDCGDNDDCEGVDFDLSGGVDWSDLSILFEKWLAGG